MVGINQEKYGFHSFHTSNSHLKTENNNFNAII